MCSVMNVQKVQIARASGKFALHEVLLSGLSEIAQIASQGIVQRVLINVQYHISETILSECLSINIATLSLFSKVLDKRINYRIQTDYVLNIPREPK